jgi:hypothetical protein
MRFIRWFVRAVMEDCISSLQLLTVFPRCWQGLDRTSTNASDGLALELVDSMSFYEWDLVDDRR